MCDHHQWQRWPIVARVRLISGELRQVRREVDRCWMFVVRRGGVRPMLKFYAIAVCGPRPEPNFDPGKIELAAENGNSAPRAPRAVSGCGQTAPRGTQPSSGPSTEFWARRSSSAMVLRLIAAPHGGRVIACMVAGARAQAERFCLAYAEEIARDLSTTVLRCLLRSPGTPIARALFTSHAAFRESRRDGGDVFENESDACLTHPAWGFRFSDVIYLRPLSGEQEV